MSARTAVIDFRFPASLAWPAEHWYEPESAREVAQQEAIRSARAQGLSDRVTDPVVLGQVAGLYGKKR